MDLLLSVKAVNLKDHDFAGIESSKEIMKRVRLARERQHLRYGREICNASVPFEEVIKKSTLTPQQQKDIQQLSIKHGLSNHVQIKIIRLARTISDLMGEEAITDAALTEALSFRKLSWSSPCIADGGR
jgi:magnesium chelatase family protein